MEIIIPESLGRIERSSLKPDGPNVVFAADNHPSWLAQKGIAKFYSHLAENYHLTTVSFENADSGYEQKARPPARRYNRKLLREALETGSIDHPFFRAHSRQPLTYDQLIIIGATVEGHPLNIVKAIADPVLRRLSAASVGYLHTDDEVIRRSRVPDAELDALRQGRDIFFDRTLGAMEFMGESTAERLANRLPYIMDSKSFEEKEQQGQREMVREFFEAAQDLKTEDQFELLLDRMGKTGEKIGLICMGESHKEMVWRMAMERQVGYASFVPEGSEIVDPVLETAYRKGLEELIYDNSG